LRSRSLDGGNVIAWEARVSYTQDGHYLTMAPRIAGSKVIVGVSGVDHPSLLFVFALDGKAALPTAVAAQAPNASAPARERAN
jgi:hypothetical protein